MIKSEENSLMSKREPKVQVRYCPAFDEINKVCNATKNSPSPMLCKDVESCPVKNMYSCLKARKDYYVQARNKNAGALRSIYQCMIEEYSDVMKDVRRIFVSERVDKHNKMC